MTLTQMLWSNLPMWLGVGFFVFLIPILQGPYRTKQKFIAGLGCGVLTVLLLATYATWQFMTART